MNREEDMFMELTRRGFLKLTGTTVSATVLGSLGFDLSPVVAYAFTMKLKGTQEVTTICPYCAVGCGIIVHVRDGKVVETDGDADHPINEGTLCSKGASLKALSADINPMRVTKPRYRAPGAMDWKDVSWDWALDEIAKRIKKTRDATFIVKNDKGQVVNRTDALASVGSAAMDNEECYIYQKFLRGLGLVYIEHQARI